MEKPVIAALDHVVLRVSQLESTVRFYVEVLGCVVAHRQPRLGLVHLRAGSALIDLVCVDSPLGRAGGQAPAPQARNLDHLCLTIANLNMQQIQQHLLTKGVVFGDVGRRYGVGGESESLYLRDPEGNGIELKTSVS